MHIYVVITAFSQVIFNKIDNALELLLNIFTFKIQIVHELFSFLMVLQCISNKYRTLSFSFYIFYE